MRILKIRNRRDQLVQLFHFKDKETVSQSDYQVTLTLFHCELDIVAKSKYIHSVCD